MILILKHLILMNWILKNLILKDFKDLKDLDFSVWGGAFNY
jgi:hypothetical protein